jgi:hypothetical protein
VDRRRAGVLITGVAEIRAHLDRGAPWDACDAFRAAIGEHPNDGGLLYFGALAHARAGATQVAHALLDKAQATAPSRELVGDIASLRGRLLKDAFHRAPERVGAAKLVGEAREQYQKAYAIAHDTHPGINAAALAMLAGDVDAARTLAREVRLTLAGRSPRSTWDEATEAEAQLLLGDLAAASECYAAACVLAAGNAGIIATMRRQVRLLVRVIPEAGALLPLLRAPDVVAFAGHMIDTGERASPRFPVALIPAVSERLDRHLATLHQPIVFTSAACGADLLFIEAALDQRAELNVVLPFDRGDFVRTSVAVGGAEWVTRFDDALERATRIIMATDENHLGDDTLFEYAARLVEGFSMLRAAQLETSPSLLCVLDASSAERVGGTRASCERWRRNINEPHVIDLHALHATASGAAPAAPETTPSPPRARPGPTMRQDPEGPNRPYRSWKTLMFADFAGFSRVHDAFAPQFHEHFLRIGAMQIAESPVKPLDAKTWGDGLYVVFDSPQDGAEFALGFLDRTLDVDWTVAGLSSTSRIRVALHAGPVFRGFDPVMGRDDFFGSSVTRTARIEPVTQPGTVYASEAFAATLAAAGGREFTLEYIGRMPLAKAYGESRIYRLDRA